MPLVLCNIGLVIDQITDDSGGLLAALTVGHPITGRFQYDTRAAASSPGSYDLPTDTGRNFISLDAGHGITWQNGSSMRVDVGNAPAGRGMDGIAFVVGAADFSVSVPMDPSLPPSPENVKCAFQLFFRDPTGRALSGASDTLPARFPAFTAWTADTDPIDILDGLVGGHIEIDNGNPLRQAYQVLAHVNSVSPA
jgi:hypothetical protein